MNQHSVSSPPCLRPTPPRPGALAVAVAAACLALGANAAPAASPPLLALSDLTRLSIEELAEIEISSVSKRAEPLADAAAAIYVITNDAIRRAGVTSLPEALRLAPNLQVARSGAHTYSITARGLTNNKLLVLLDGRILYSSLHSTVFWDMQDVLLEDVERIEVISGPGGTLWGSNAVNGVINIITRPAQETQGTLLAAGAGSDERTLAARYGAKLGANGQFRLYAKRDARDRTETASGANRRDGGHREQAGFRYDWGAGRDALTLQGDLYDADLDQATPGETSLSGGNLLARWQRTLDNGALQLQFYYDRTRRWQPGSLGEVVNSYDFDLQHSFRAGERHEIVWGGGYRLVRDDISSFTPLFDFLPHQRSMGQSNLFLQDTVSFNDALKLTVGAKLEHNIYTGWEFQPNARLAYKPGEHSLVWGAVSRAVRTPSRLDRDFYVFNLPTLPLQGGPDFMSERLTAFELGYRSQPNPRLSYSVNAFYHHYDNLRSVEAGPSPGTLVLANKIKGHSYGVELWGNYQVSERWRLSAGYNALHHSYKFKPGSLGMGSTLGSKGDATAAVSQDPAYQFALASSHTLPGDIEFDWRLRHVAALPPTNSANTAVPAYNALDARLGWHVNKRLELSLTGTNLLDRGHAETGAAPGRGEYGRSFFVKLLWKN